MNTLSKYILIQRIYLHAVGAVDQTYMVIFVDAVHQFWWFTRLISDDD